jgi:mRNA-degrading endonuclease toxin of MazEF toxin-antitoxin module
MDKNKKAFKFKNPRRGEVWIVNLGEPFGSEQGQKRPCVMLNTPRKKERTVIIAPSSKTIRPQSIAIRNYQFLCFQVRAVDRKRLCGRICRLSENETDLIADKIFSIIKNETQIRDLGLAAFLENQKPVE